MDHTRFHELEAVFAEAVDLEGDERQAVVDRACAGDDALREAVEALLAADDRSRGFLSGSLPARMVDLSSPSNPPPPPAERIGPYRVEQLLGTGGMGEVFAARRDDESFEARVAIKIVRTRVDSEEVQQRFARERAALARLDHVGIARLLDGGTLEDGRPWFAVELVEGKPFDEYCHVGALGLDARIELFLRVCDAVHHAHGRLILHRDLKPSNVLVTDQGDVKLLDFGIAKFLEEETDDGLTKRGRVWLTPEYASPEQVQGDRLTTASDVYSLGVMLYQLLTGAHPTSRSDESWRTRMDAAIDRDPEVASRAARRADLPWSNRLQGDLDAILEHALEKKPGDRYSSIEEFRGDLARTQRGESIRIRRAPWFERARRFARRRASLLALVSVLVGSTILGSGTLQWAAHSHEDAAAQFQVSERGALNAEQRLQRELGSLMQMSDVWLAKELQRRALEELWPLDRRQVPAMRDWIERSEGLLARVPGHREERQRIESGETQVASEIERAWRLAELDRLLQATARLAEPEVEESGTLAEMRARIVRSEQRSTESLDHHADHWEDAIDDIASLEVYGGLELEPQHGLVPLDVDAESGLWEFFVLGTGDPPERGLDERWQITTETGVVLVLVPGATMTLGAQAESENRPHFDPDATPRETPYRVSLSPFFLSKYELSQDQWERIHGTKPSRYGPHHERYFSSTRQAVDSVSWWMACEGLHPLGLTLPTESQWECAARGGTTTPFWCGVDVASIAQRRAGNVADQTIATQRPDGAAAIDDGVLAIGEIDLYEPNPFGLHNILGNVFEWCLDWYRQDRGEPRADDGLFAWDDGTEKVVRGGAFIAPAVDARSANRGRVAPDVGRTWVGVRPARAVEWTE